MAKKTAALFQSIFSPGNSTATRKRQRERDLHQEEEDAAFERELDNVCGKSRDVEARIRTFKMWNADEDNKEILTMIIKEEL